jgi:hypothetical protein
VEQRENTLRHSAAVAWLEAGVCTSRRWPTYLGIPSIAITGDVYAHTSDDTTWAAVESLAGVLGS